MDINVNEFMEEIKKIQTNLLDFLEHGRNFCNFLNDLFFTSENYTF